MIRLKYVKPGRYFNGVPARDLTDWDLNLLPDYITEVELVSSGVYEPVEHKPKARRSEAEEKQADAPPEVNE